MATDGWVCFYRKIEEWEWYKTPHMLHLFFHLIVKANHKDGKWQGMEVMRGQLITGRKSLSSETGISEQTIRTCLKRLEHSSEIVQKSTSKFSVITILNYNEYQTKEKPANQQPTSNQPATNQQLTTNNNVNNVNKTTISKESDPYFIEASFLIEVVSLRRKTTVTPSQKKAWCNTIRLMVEKDGVDAANITTALNWYKMNWMNEFVPVISSASALREKWLKLLNAIDRDGSKTTRRGNNGKHNGFNSRDYQKDASSDEAIENFLNG